MLCVHCQKRQATKTKEEEFEGKKVSRCYCAECYHALFLGVDESIQASPSQCPYCGKSKESVLRSGLVGCANCYKAFEKELIPVVVNTQGDRSHTGKQPYAVDRAARLQARYNELQTLIRQRTEEENVEKVAEYSRESTRIKALKERR